ncbi:MAG: DUF2680 domain-containing protein [Firmicutes bacterium]|jgi:predicted PurR-regulated permease PerM|nr:DUF2680 domain-containing protein [Bacillota bacterium]
MKKSLVILLVVALLTVVAVPAALALTDSRKSELRELYEQMFGLREQIVDKQAEAGLITEEEAAQIKARLAEIHEYRRQQMDAGNYTFGFGSPGRGRGGGRGIGRGGCGRCPVYRQKDIAAPDA